MTSQFLYVNKELFMPHIHRAKEISNSDSDIAKQTVQNYRYRFRSVETTHRQQNNPTFSDVAIAITQWKRAIRPIHSERTCLCLFPLTSVSY